jgi:D-lactate dehydrogenase (quinone)
MLMIEVDGPAHCLDEARQAVARAAASARACVEMSTPRADAAEVAALWKTRKALSPALRTSRRRRSTRTWWCPVSRMGS